MILKQAVLSLLLVMTLLVTVAGCAPAPTPLPAEVPQAKEEGEIQRIIEVKAEGLTVHYSRQSFWGEKEFSHHLANQAKFKSDFKKDFEQGLAQSDRPVTASDYSFSFDRTTCSTVTRCDIHGAISKRGDKYHATFFWLLRPLGLDFIDDKFRESEKELFWEGSIQGVPTTVTLELPVSGFGNCHAHAWWSD